MEIKLDRHSALSREYSSDPIYIRILNRLAGALEAIEQEKSYNAMYCSVISKQEERLQEMYNKFEQLHEAFESK